MMAEACPRQPDMITFPAKIGFEDLYTDEQLTELKELEV